MTKKIVKDDPIVPLDKRSGLLKLHLQQKNLRPRVLRIIRFNKYSELKKVIKSLTNEFQDKITISDYFYFTVIFDD